MNDEHVDVPAGVVIAAVVLGLMAFLALLFTGFSAIVLFVTHNRVIPNIPTVRMVAAGLDAVMLALVILCFCTVYGLFRMKIWARYSVVLLGLLDFLAFGLMTAGILIGRARSGLAAAPLPNNPNITIGDVMIWLAAFYAVLALIGVWWMVYFNTKHVRQAFAVSEARLIP
jgi:hypothetical protein